MFRYLLAALLAACGLARAADRPSVILILADDLGWADLGCYGSKYHKTPHLDRLAAQGLRFTDAYAAAPICSPSRAALLTGQYPARLNLTDWLPGRPDRPDQKLLRPVINQHLPTGTPTLPAMLKKAGYATGHIGKWHLGGKGSLPTDHGFDVSIGGDQSGSPASYFAPFKNPAGRFMPGLEQAPEGEYLTDRLGNEAVKFITTNRERPFFLYLAHYAPHIPLRAKKELVAKYKPGKPGEQGNPLYAAMLESLDESVGTILKGLDDLKLTEKTIVIFTSDNGGLSVLEGPDTPATINSPLREGKGYLYEGGLRVPLIIRGPNVTKPETTTSEPVHGIDLMPTLCETCMAKGPVELDGISLVPALKGGALKSRPLFWHYPHYSNQGGKPGMAMRVDNHKLIEWFDDRRQEFYDLRADPSESRNLIDELPSKPAVLKMALAISRSKAGASLPMRMPTPNPNYVPNPQAKDGTITLPARNAEVHGVQLRYEPLPHKNTLGYWIRAEDWASWEFTVTTPGKFTLEVLQGCGKGQGGSEVRVSLGEQNLTFTVEDTGHFQNFKPRELGALTIDKPGKYVLEVRPTKKAAAAVMDLRQVTLKPVK